MTLKRSRVSVLIIVFWCLFCLAFAVRIVKVQNWFFKKSYLLEVVSHCVILVNDNEIAKLLLDKHGSRESIIIDWLKNNHYQGNRKINFVLLKFVSSDSQLDLDEILAGISQLNLRSATLHELFVFKEINVADNHVIFALNTFFPRTFYRYPIDFHGSIYSGPLSEHFIEKYLLCDHYNGAYFLTVKD